MMPDWFRQISMQGAPLSQGAPPSWRVRDGRTTGARSVSARVGPLLLKGRGVRALVFILIATSVASAQTPPRDRAATTQPSRVEAVTTNQPPAPLPEIADEDLGLLVKFARRAFGHELQGLPERPAPYRPPALEPIEMIVHLTLRDHGTLVAEAESRRLSVVDAAMAAGVLLARDVKRRDLSLRTDGDPYGLEMELVGPPEYLAGPFFVQGGVWAKSLLHAFEPAVEGIGVTYAGKTAWTRPGEIMAANYSPDLALKAAESAAGVRHFDKLQHPGDIRYFRFRGYHLWQTAAGEAPIRLIRGDAVVPPEAVSDAGLDAAIGRIADYLEYRRKASGWFSFEYQPNLDRYRDRDTAATQLAAMFGLSTAARWTGDADTVSKARESIGAAVEFLRPLSVPEIQEGEEPRIVERGRFLHLPDHEAHLEVTALLLLAIEALQGDANAEQRDAIVEALHACQDEDGRIEMRFKERGPDEPEAYYAAGLAIEALARVGMRGPNPRLDVALQRAALRYDPARLAGVGPRGAAALARGFSYVYAVTNDARVSDRVFALLDPFVALQVTADNCPWPELYGAINAGRPGEVGADTALFLSALAQGLRLAERIGDDARADRYRDVVHAAARFVMQLEFREAGTYFVRSPRDVLGGIRSAPWNNRLRTDETAEALRALIDARKALYGAPPPTPRAADKPAS